MIPQRQGVRGLAGPQVPLCDLQDCSPHPAQLIDGACCLPCPLPHRYEYSLGAFLTVFNQTLNTSKRDVILDNRLHNVIEALTFDVYSYTCLGLFEQHKLMFSFQMTIKIMEGGGA